MQSKIKLSKMVKSEIIVLKEATEIYYRNLMLDEKQNDILKIFQSILQSLYNKFYDAHAKAYKQDKFSFKLMYHEAALLVKALSFFNDATTDSYNKNLALTIILKLDPQTK